jgi:hypothetical protein
MVKSSNSNVLRMAHTMAHRERAASHLNESTRHALEHCILALGGDDSAVYVPYDSADKARDAMHRNFGHREVIGQDIAMYNPAAHEMSRLVRIPISAIESEQINDAIGKKLIQGAATFVNGSMEENGHALMNELARRGQQRA